jgi:hypothetical protein
VSQRLVIALLVAVGCSSEPSQTQEQAPNLDDAITVESSSGPVTARVSLAPKEPRLGDRLSLRLEVTAKSGVSVTMPPYGDVMGRFQVLKFKRKTANARDSVTHTQTYSLQAVLSGRQRIPPLRIEFVDSRNDAEEAENIELLTEEIAFQIQSVLPEGEVTATLHPALGELDPSPGTSRWLWILLGAALFATVGGGLLYRNVLTSRRQQRRISAYDKALARLRRLENSGLPDADQADSWYVELSAIVRHYIEERFEIRAPELTTEEFLREARRAHGLNDDNRALLTSFLDVCDRVKFAAHHPETAESEQALTKSRRFLDDTRLQATEVAQ